MLSVAQVCDLQPGDAENATWINPGFSGVVIEITSKLTKAKKNFWPCVIQDLSGEETISVSFFTAPKFREGDTVEIHGKGLRRTEFNGQPQAAIGRETVVDVVHGTRERAPAPRSSAPQDDSRGGNSHAGTTHEPTPAGVRINGQTVGMAMKESLALLTKDLTPDQIVERIVEPAFWEAVHEVASDVIRVSLILEAGKLAKPVKERAGNSEDVPY